MTRCLQADTILMMAIFGQGRTIYSHNSDLFVYLSYMMQLFFCRREWPVQGGECDQLSGDKPSIIITGNWLTYRNVLPIMSTLPRS